MTLSIWILIEVTEMKRTAELGTTLLFELETSEVQFEATFQQRSSFASGEERE